MGEWKPIAEAPLDGTRLRLGHELDPSSMKTDAYLPVYGAWDGSSWSLNAFFTIPGGRRGMLTEHPTHFLPPPPSTEGGV